MTARNEDTSSGRRRSFAFFSRPTILADSDLVTSQPQPQSPWTNDDGSLSSPTKSRPKSLFGGVSGLTEVSAVVSSRKVLTKTPTQRPKSMFGSLKSRDSTSVVVTSSASSSLEESSMSEGQRGALPPSSIIMQSGEVVTGGGLLRKKRDYLVLTNRELVKYKSEAKALEAFYGKDFNGSNKGRASSVGSAVVTNASEHTFVTMMNQVVAVYCPSTDHELGNTVQIDYLDGAVGQPSSTIFTTASPAEARSWMDKLRAVAAQTRACSPPLVYPDSTVEHIARRLEAERDYSPMHFQVYRVVQRSGKSGNKSTEDLQKMYSTMCYLAIGIHKVHLVPMRFATNKSTASSSSPTLTTSFGILSLSGLWISNSDDCFSLVFRAPCRHPHKLSLASSDAPEIIQAIRQAAEYLRPMWQIQPYSVHIPESMKDEALPDIPPTPGDDLNGFDRTLAAYCTAYEIDASNIVYGVATDVEDAPQFQLYAPAHPRRQDYSDLELLAVLRTLRWNDAFCSISFRGISLDSLASVLDLHGAEYEPKVERSGRAINLKMASQGAKNLLVHELRALALYTGKLRRMDFYECIKNGNVSSGSCSPVEPGCDRACPIVEAIMPLCRRGLTNVDWFNLTGIELGEADLDWLVDAAASRLAHFRGFELARCGLTERMLTLFLNALSIHENTLEALDICGNPCRMHAPTLNNAMAYFPILRKLNLSRLLRTKGDDPVLTAETLHRWRLEDLDLSETKLNEETVEAIATYLASPQSDALHHLALSQCGLTAQDVALLMHSMEREKGKARSLHLYVGSSSLGHNSQDFIDCISQGRTPSHLTMRMVDYPKEEPFQEFIRALTVNKTIVYLDMGKISLPYEAGEKTSALLGKLFAGNTTLRELDISGEQAVLESASLGAGLLNALSRIAENKSLEILRIELQSLGTPGAMELASMLPKNTTLRELHCEMNDIHLQGFTAMVNALEHNHTLLYLPRMDRDRMDQMRLLKENLCQPAIPDNWDHRTHYPSSSSQIPEKEKKKSTFRKPSRAKKVSFSEEDALMAVDVEQNLKLLEEKWESEVVRLQKLLSRNMNLRLQALRSGSARAPIKRPGVHSAGSISSMALLWGVDGR